MSLINQMLQDLDARRASGAELALVPRYVRSLPRAERSRVPWWWIALAGTAIGVAAALGWRFASAPTFATVPTSAIVPIAQPVPKSVAPLASAANEPATPAPLPRETQAGFVPASALIAREMPGGAFREPSIEPARAPKAAVVENAEPASPSNAARVPSPTRESAPAVQAAVSPPQIDKRVQQASPRELAENEFRDATALLHQGRPGDAQEKFRLALQHFPAHGSARQALFGLLVKTARLPEAEQVLQEGLLANGPQPVLAMALARMQVDRGDTVAAVETLQRSAAAAQGSADYIAFLAALMQRQGRHVDAVEQYQAALAHAPGSGLWSMGLAISLQALQRNAEARAAYRRALASQALSPELNAFIDQQIRLLQ